MSDLEYIYAVARVRVKEKSLLSDADIAQLSGLKDEATVLAYLADKGWGDQNTAKDPERMLTVEEEKTREFIRELKLDPAAFELLSYQQLYHNLKAGIKESITPDTNLTAFYEDERYGRDQMLAILEEKDYKKLPEHMQGVAERAYNVMLKTRDGQLLDIIVDRACLEAMEAAGRRSRHALLKNYAENTVAVTNIKIAVRAAKTGKKLNFLKEALADTDSINVRLLAIAASEGEEALLTFLKEHGFAEAAEALAQSPSAFERWCDNRLIDTIQPEKTNPFSMGPIIAYYLARLNEIKTVRMILVAKANAFPEEMIRERVRKMYG